MHRKNRRHVVNATAVATVILAIALILYHERLRSPLLASQLFPPILSPIHLHSRYMSVRM